MRRQPFGMAACVALPLLASAAAVSPCAPDARPSASILAHYALDRPPAWRVELARDLGEVSGLAFAPDGRLFAHGDEAAVVWELDPRSGHILKRFELDPRSGPYPSMGKRPRPGVVAGDFEDIAIVGERFFLLSSNGVLLEFRDGRDGERVPFRAYDTGLAGSCELEGLAYEDSSRSLLLLCKEAYRRDWRTGVVVLRWSLDDGRLRPRGVVAPAARVAEVTGAGAFHGSALAVADRAGAVVLVAGPERRILELSPTGEVIAGGALDPRRHRQPEGLAFAPDRTLLVADEGGGKRATLSAYAYQE